MTVSGGCKLFGAYRTVIGVKDAAVLIHSTVGCNWGTSTFHITSRQNDIRQASSVLYEEDIIYGGRSSLERALENMAGLYDCAAVFVLTGCVAEIMEDDIEGFIKSFSFPKPVILVKAAGFKGDMDSGVEDAVKTLIDRMDKRKRRKDSINIVGIFSDDFKCDEDLSSIKRLLGEKIEINSVLPYDSYAAMLNAPAASLNVIFKGFEYIGVQMEQNFGIPYVVADYPYGIGGSRSFATKVNSALGHTGMDFLNTMESDAVKRLERAYEYVHNLYGMPAAVKGDPARANALKNFLENELGMNVKVFQNSSSGGKADDFEEAVAISDAVIVFGSSYERGVADNLNIPLIRYAYPIFDSISIGNRSYAGFEGAVNMVEDMVNASMTIGYKRDGMYG